MSSRALQNQQPAPIVSCPGCTRTYDRAQFAAIHSDGSGFRRCRCGMPLVKSVTLTLDDVVKAYEAALKED